jgi:hypothetical protein
LASLVSLAPFVAIGHVIWVAVSEHGGDLAEGLKRARLWMVAILILATLVSVASEYIPDPGIAALVRIGLSGLPGMAALYIWLVSLDPGGLRFVAVAPKPAPAAPGVDPRDQALLSALYSAMNGGLFREPGLKIEKVAEALKTPRATRQPVFARNAFGRRLKTGKSNPIYEMSRIFQR